MKKLLMVLVLVSSTSYARESWRCTEEGTTREGSAFVSCGMGQATEEGTARELAFSMARNEFEALCSMDTDCKKHKVRVEPGRTTCEFHKAENAFQTNQFKCYRLIRFVIGGKI